MHSKFEFRSISVGNTSLSNDEEKEVQNRLERVQSKGGNGFFSIHDSFLQRETNKAREEESDTDSEDSEDEPIVQIPEESKWGRLAIRGIYNSHAHCPSLLRSEDEFLTLKIEDDMNIQEKLDFSKEVREGQSEAYLRIIQDIERQQQSIAKIAQKKINLSSDAAQFETEMEVAAAETQQQKERQQLLTTMEEEMKAHIMEDFLHLGEMVFENNPSSFQITKESAVDEFFDAAEFTDDYNSL